MLLLTNKELKNPLSILTHTKANFGHEIFGESMIHNTIILRKSVCCGFRESVTTSLLQLASLTAE